MPQEQGTDLSFSVEICFRLKQLSQNKTKNPYQLLHKSGPILNLSLYFEASFELELNQYKLSLTWPLIRTQNLLLVLLAP